jgi:hypothetical protein
VHRHPGNLELGHDIVRLGLTANRTGLAHVKRERGASSP